MPSPAFTLASEALLARTAASHLVTACSPRNKPRTPRWPPRSDGFVTPANNRLDFAASAYDAAAAADSPVTRQPFCRMQLLELKRCPCPARGCSNRPLGYYGEPPGWGPRTPPQYWQQVQLCPVLLAIQLRGEQNLLQLPGPWPRGRRRNRAREVTARRRGWVQTQRLVWIQLDRNPVLN